MSTENRSCTLNKDVTIESPKPRSDVGKEAPRMDDLGLRFVFNRSITEQMVRNLAIELRRVINEDDFKARTIFWEGINTLDLTTRFWAQKWLRQTRKKSSGANSIDAPPPLEPSGPASSLGGSRVPTPNQEDMAVEPEVGEDEGLPSDKPVSGPSAGDAVADLRQTVKAHAHLEIPRKKRKRMSGSNSGTENQLDNDLMPQKRSKREGREARSRS